MPKAAVHEHRHALTRKHEIGMTPQPRQGSGMLAKAKSQSVDCRAHGNLRTSVPRTVSLHDAPHR